MLSPFNLHNTTKIIPMVFIIGIICSCNNKEEVKDASFFTEQEKNPISKGKNVSLIYSEKSTVKIKISAPIMEEYLDGEEKYTEMAEGVEILFYGPLLKIKSTLTSKYAIQQTSKKIVEVKNDVVVVNDKGEQLNTEYLIWIEDSSKIYSEESVKITTKDEIIIGEGMEANQDFSKWKIHKITGVINIKEKTDTLNTN